MLWGMMAISLGLGIGIFFVTPLLLTRLVDPFLPSDLLSVLVEGVIRIALFFGYVWLIGRLPDIRRVFAYHGAEHKAINALEAGAPLEPGPVSRYSVAHPRCGTSFLLVVVVLSIFVFGLLGRPSLPVRIASRIALVPVVAAVAYEVIRFSARRTGNPAVRLILAPGLALQRMTTREPDRGQVEVAIAALQRVMEMDGRAPGPHTQRVPGSRRPVAEQRQRATRKGWGRGTWPFSAGGHPSLRGERRPCKTAWRRSKPATSSSTSCWPTPRCWPITSRCCATLGSRPPRPRWSPSTASCAGCRRRWPGPGPCWRTGATPSWPTWPGKRCATWSSGRESCRGSCAWPSCPATPTTRRA